MRKLSILAGVGFVGAVLLGSVPTAAQQPATVSTSHLIVIKLVERTGNPIPFGFEPAAFTAERGDTLEFVQFANTMHNVHFKIVPKGAKLGGSAVSPYLTARGETYRIVVDSRFTPGSYEIICDPHEMLGMHAMLTVATPTASR